MRVWILKYNKRFLRQKVFLFLLLVMPVSTFLFAAIVNRDDSSIRVGIVYTDDSSLGGRIGQELLKHRGIVRFCQMNSDEELRQAIGQGEIECGYSFPKDMGEKYQAKQYAGVIKQYFRRGSMLYTIAREVMLTGIFRQYAEDLAVSYMYESDLFQTRNITSQEISEHYNQNINDQTTFTLAFNDSTKVESKLKDYLVAPIRGCMSLLILLAGFCGLSLYQKDRYCEIPIAFAGKMRNWFSVLSISIPVCLVSIAGIISEMACGIGFLSLKEIVYLFIYDIIIVLFCNLLSFTRVREGMLWVSALTYVCICAVLTPVFFDMSVLVPGIKPFSYVCLTNYFLVAVFGGIKELAQLLLLLFILVGANLIRYRMPLALHRKGEVAK